MTPIDELLSRRVEQVLPSKAALKKLLSIRPITLYQGFDPSAPNLHIGHLVGLLQLKMFQDLGHQVIFLIGDFTGMIGDPTDKTSTRPKLTREQVLLNTQTYQNQAGKILRFTGDNAAKIKFNSQWLDQLNFAELVDLSSYFTVQQLIERDMFQARLKNHQPIYLHEFLYPLMVTYDALTLQVDLEIAGNDQMFNMTVGRSLIKDRLHKDKFALTLKLLTDSQGNKIGKTTGNAINLFTDPKDLYGSLMSQPDSLIVPGLTLATDLNLNEIAKLTQLAQTDPLSAKKRFSFEVVKLCHGEPVAAQAQAQFTALFQSQGTVSNIPQVSLPATAITTLDLLKGLDLKVSHTQLKRVVEAGGVEYNGRKVTNLTASLTPKSGDIIKFGKHQFYQLDVH